MLSDSAIIQQVALHLGAPWKFNHLENPDSIFKEIVDGNGRKLIFSCWRSNKKFNISGRLPTRFHGRQSKSIGISKHRDPSVIANDIKRRLIPDYLLDYEKALEVVKHQKEKDETTKHVTNLIKKLTRGNDFCHGLGTNNVHCDLGVITIYDSENIKIDFRMMGAEDAIKLLAFACKK